MPDTQPSATRRDQSSPAVRFLKATLAGGLLFLLPLVLLAVLTGHAIAFAKKLVGPLDNALHVERTLGASGETVVAVVLLLLIAIGAGLVARTRAGRSVIDWSERTILGGLPQYQFVKSMAAGMAELEETNLTPVLVSIEDGWQIGYLLEPLTDGWVAVFLPQAPTPMSGNVMYFPAERTRKLDISIVQAMAIIKRMGLGSAAALRSADLALPKGA
jgi:uncharacterized membrane protein